MAGIDSERTFKPVHVALLTVSSTRTEANDKSGQKLRSLFEGAGHVVKDQRIVTDSRDAISEIVRGWIRDENIDAVISTGGTGVTGSDCTPEAFEALYDKAIPGFGEIFRMLSYEKIGASTIQSRATAGVASGTYLFALPGSTSACQDAWDGILQYQLDSRFRPCNLVELMPRLREAESTSG